MSVNAWQATNAWSGSVAPALPTVNAGPDLTATNGDTVTLSGATASNYDSLLWTCTSGQSPTFSDATALNPTVTFNETGVHTLQLAATNAEGTATSTLTATVDAIPNIGPTANAGANQSVAAGATVNLDGTGSTDGDGTIASYAWTQTVGDTVTLTGATTATPTFTAPSTNTAQTLSFELTVTDDGGLTATDSVDVQVAAQVIESTLNATLTGITDGTYLTRVVDTDNDALLFKDNKAWANGEAVFTLPVAVGTNVEYYAYETSENGAGLQIGVTE